MEIRFARERRECGARRARASNEIVVHQYWSRHEDRYGTKMSPQYHNVPLMESQYHVINPTNPGGTLDDGVEDRLHIRRRAADDAEHLGRCRLMLQSLA